MRSININGYEYQSTYLLFSPRSVSYYRGSSDPLTRRLYAALNAESVKEVSPFYSRDAGILLNNIFFVCACLFEDRDPKRQIDKHLGWTTMEADEDYRELPLYYTLAKYCCALYSCVLTVLAVQRELPKKVRDFMQAAQQKIVESRWANDFRRAQATILKALDGDDGTPQLYDTDLRPSVSLEGLRWIAENYPVEMEPFLTPDGIRMVLSRIRDAEERTAAINLFQRQQRLSTTADPIYDWVGFFAGLRTELQQTSKTEQESATDQEPPAPEPEQTAQLQQQLAENDALIAKLQQEIEELKNAPKSQAPTEDTAETASLKQKIEDLGKTIEDLKKQLKTAGEEYVCRIINDELKGTEKMIDSVRFRKYEKMEYLLTMKGVPEKAKDAIKALLISNKSGAPQTTANNFHGPVEQVANNIEEQHITKEKKQQ